MGIYIQSAGVITLKNIYAVGNGRGADIDNDSGIGKAVSISNADFSDSVSSEGLIVSSKGVITLTDVVSSGKLGRWRTTIKLHCKFSADGQDHARAVQQQPGYLLRLINRKAWALSP